MTQRVSTGTTGKMLREFKAWLAGGMRSYEDICDRVDALVGPTAAEEEPTKLNDLLSPRDAAAALGVSVSTLATWRCVQRYGLRFVKVGSLVKYRLCEVERFKLARTSSSSRST